MVHLTSIVGHSILTYHSHTLGHVKIFVRKLHCPFIICPLDSNKNSHQLKNDVFILDMTTENKVQKELNAYRQGILLTVTDDVSKDR